MENNRTLPHHTTKMTNHTQENHTPDVNALKPDIADIKTKALSSDIIAPIADRKTKALSSDIMAPVATSTATASGIIDAVHDITQRQQEILDYLAQLRFASIAELSAAIYTSEATVRREIHKLEAKGLLKSVYGGVVMSEYSKEVVPVSLRDSENSAQKEKIAADAAKLILDNSIVIFDASSTVRRICKHIQGHKNLTVITNNLRVCQELKDSPVHVYCTGGSLLPRRECFVGHFAEEFIRKVKADQIFFSSQGLSENGDITDSSVEEIALRKVMLESAKEKIFLCDSSKKNKDYPFTLCNISDVTKVISE